MHITEALLTPIRGTVNQTGGQHSVNQPSYRTTNKIKKIGGKTDTALTLVILLGGWQSLIWLTVHNGQHRHSQEF